jgi:integrase
VALRAGKEADFLLIVARLRQAHAFTVRISADLPEQRGTGYDIRTVRDLLGHADVAATMIYTHVLRQGAVAVRSPMDAMGLV